MIDSTENVILTNMCMVYKDDEVLVQERTNTRWDGFAFPGGHIEKGESFTDAVIREVWEETGLTIHAPQLCGIKDWVNQDGVRYIVLFYKTNQFEGITTSSDEGEVSWVKLEDLKNMNLARGMKEMINIFMNDSLSEMFYDKNKEKWIIN